MVDGKAGLIVILPFNVDPALETGLIAGNESSESVRGVAAAVILLS